MISVLLSASFGSSETAFGLIELTWGWKEGLTSFWPTQAEEPTLLLGIMKPPLQGETNRWKTYLTAEHHIECTNPGLEERLPYGSNLCWESLSSYLKSGLCRQWVKPSAHRLSSAGGVQVSLSHRFDLSLDLCNPGSVPGCCRSLHDTGLPYPSHLLSAMNSKSGPIQPLLSLWLSVKTPCLSTPWPNSLLVQLY